MNYTLERCELCGGKYLEASFAQPTQGWEERLAAVVPTRPFDDVDWRLLELLEAGLPVEEAESLAWRPEIDVRRLCKLVREGCPIVTALRIMA